jgi:DnaJ-class molecular chaperone
VPLTTAVLGGEVAVPTLTGKVLLKVPPLSQNGRQFRLAGLGMPALNTGKRGDLLARLRIKLPEKLSDKEKQLFEQLKEAGV